MPKVFVGTLYAGEGDFGKCCEAIESQADVDVKHVVIRDLPEREAHNRLWQAWRDVQREFDMFVKVDADTVLTHAGVLVAFWHMMQENPRVTGIQAPLLDYFTNDYIAGLNCFSPRVTFQDTTDELFCDRQVDVGHDVVVKGERVNQALKPAGYHCLYANDAQAFHFGLHRALKGQALVIDKVHKVWQQRHDRTRKLALLGAGAATSSLFNKSGINYGDEAFQQALTEALARLP